MILKKQEGLLKLHRHRLEGLGLWKHHYGGIIFAMLLYKKELKTLKLRLFNLINLKTMKPGNEFDYLSISEKRNQIKQILCACQSTIKKEVFSKNDIIFFEKSKRKVTPSLLEELFHKLDKAADKELIELFEDLSYTYPFFNLKELKLSISIAKNNIKFAQEDGNSSSSYDEELERLNKELNKFNNEWGHIFK